MREHKDVLSYLKKCVTERKSNFKNKGHSMNIE